MNNNKNILNIYLFIKLLKNNFKNYNTLFLYNFSFLYNINIT